MISGKLKKEEIKRKVLHIFSGTFIPAWIYYGPKIPGIRPWLPTFILAFIFVASFCVEFIRFKVQTVQNIFYKLFGSFLRDEESFKITGSTWIFASATVCSIFYPREIAAMVICLFILGDGVAAIIGMKFGKVKIGNKSLEGFAACFLTCQILFLGFFPLIPGLIDFWDGKIPFWYGIVVSAGISLLELIPLRIGKFVINDNLIVPLANGALMVWLRRF